MGILTTHVARIVFALPFGASGVLHFVYGGQMAQAVPLPGGIYWVYFVGACLIAGFFSLVTGKFGKWAALGIALMLLGFICFIHVPGVLNPQMRMYSFSHLLKDTGLLGGALTWAGIFARGEAAKSK
jgi:putative oxidoreductase